jgi:hypothetical protein
LAGLFHARRGEEGSSMMNPAIRISLILLAVAAGIAGVQAIFLG